MLRKTPRINQIGLVSGQGEVLKKVTHFEVVPISEVLAKARPLEDAEPEEAVQAPPESVKTPRRSQHGLTQK